MSFASSMASTSGARIPHVGAPPAPPTDGDPYWDYVILFEEFRPESPFTDSSKYHHTLALSNDPQLDAGPFEGIGALIQHYDPDLGGFISRTIAHTGVGGVFCPNSTSVTIDVWVYVINGISTTLVQFWRWSVDADATEFLVSEGTHGNAPTALTVDTNAGAATGGLTEFPVGSWKFVRTLLNAPEETCEVYIDGELAQSFHFSLGTDTRECTFYTGPFSFEQNQNCNMLLAQLRVTKGILRDPNEVPTAPFPAHG